MEKKLATRYSVRYCTPFHDKRGSELLSTLTFIDKAKIFTIVPKETKP